MSEKVTECLKCGAPVPEATTGRPPIYCGETCRQVAAYEIKRVGRRLDALEDRAASIREKLAEEPFDRGRKAYYDGRRREAAFVGAEIERYEDRLRRLLGDGGRAPEREVKPA